MKKNCLFRKCFELSKSRFPPSLIFLLLYFVEIYSVQKTELVVDVY